MNAHPIETEAPPNSRIIKRLAGSSFYDSWCITSEKNGLSALDYFIEAVKRTPRWVDMCMSIRNQVGRLVRLKDLGTLSNVDASKKSSDYMPGDRIGIFTLFENTPDEALIGDNDRHLSVVLSIHRREHLDINLVTITVTTVVHVKNMLGRFYMLPVRPMHKLIAPAVLRAIG